MSREVVPSFTMITQNVDAHPLLRLMHKPELDKAGQPLTPEKQDKRAVVPVEEGDWDTRLHGTVEQARALIKIPPLEVFEHGPEDDAKRVALNLANSHMDPELRRIELFYMQSEATWGSDRKMPFKNLVHMRGQLVKKYTNWRKKEFEVINDELVNSMGPLFDGLLVEYRRQKDRLAKLV